MASPLLEAISQGIAPPVRELTLPDVEALIESRGVQEGEPLELLDGMLVLKDRPDPGALETDPMTQGPSHAGSVSRLTQVFSPWQPNPHWHLRVQLPVMVSERHAPEPDAAIVRGSPADYDARHPSPADVLVAIESSGTSLRFDQSTKQRIYASGNVPPYVVVNLADRVVELYEFPDSALGQYTCRTLVRPGDVLRLNLAGTGIVEVSVDDLLPGA